MLCPQVFSAVASVATTCVAFDDALSATHCTRTESMSRTVIVSEWLHDLVALNSTQMELANACD